jgi:hypothetical protein
MMENRMRFMGICFVFVVAACAGDSSEKAPVENTEDAGTTDGTGTDQVGDTGKCWWCTDAEDEEVAQLKPPGTGGDDKGGGDKGGDDKGGDDKGGALPCLSPKECFDACIAKGQSEEFCEKTCQNGFGGWDEIDGCGGGKDDGGGDGGMVDEACFDACIAKGADEEVCKEACSDDGGDDKGSDDGDGVCLTPEECFDACMKKGGKEAECLSTCKDGFGCDDGDDDMPKN